MASATRNFGTAPHSTRRCTGKSYATAAAFALLASPALCLSLSLPPGSDRTGSDQLASGVQLPIGISRDGEVPRADFGGSVQREAYFVPSAEGTLALAQPLSDQLSAAGWEILVDCATAACGGFDFRFALEVLPEPAMHVDLGDFRYLAAKKQDEMIAILASRRGAAGYLQITHASRPAPTLSQAEIDLLPLSPDERGTGEGGPAGQAPPAVVITPGPVANPVTEGAAFVAGKLGERLESLGHVVLEDLIFATGSTNLGAGPFASLEELAAYLALHPTRKLALVGHTDATGGLEVNITVSRRRAQSVLEHLVKTYKTPRAQLSAEGVGFLAPLQSNLADQGRGANRRVEAVLLAVE